MNNETVITEVPAVKKSFRPSLKLVALTSAVIAVGAATVLVLRKSSAADETETD